VAICELAECARRFAALVEEPDEDPHAWCEELFRLLRKLMRDAFALSTSLAGEDVGDVTTSGLESSDGSAEEQRGHAVAAARLGELGYAHVPGTGGAPVTVRGADAVARIYRALERGRAGWRADDDTAAREAGRVWATSFNAAGQAYLRDLYQALVPRVTRPGHTGVTLLADEATFFADVLARHPEWAAHIRRVPASVDETWTARAEIPSPTGDAALTLVLWLESGAPSVGLGRWHTHADDMAEFWDLADAILADQLVLAVDVGGARDGHETAIDLREPDALAQHMQQPNAPAQIRIKSFGGTHPG